jgi:hypothetical protein
MQSYAESSDAFRNRWRLRNFRFRRTSWLAAALLLAALAGIAWRFGDAHLALKAVLAVMALIAVLPLISDFRRPQCVHCGAEPERISARTIGGEDNVITACHQCRVLRVAQADSHPLTL